MSSHLKKCERERRLEKIRGKAKNGNGRNGNGGRGFKLTWSKGDGPSMAYVAAPLVLAVGVYQAMPAGPLPHAFIISKHYGPYILRLLVRMAETFNVSEELGEFPKLADAKREAQRLVDAGVYRRVPDDWWDKHDPRGAAPPKVRQARRNLAAGASISEVEVDEWRTELLEASDAGQYQVLGYNEKVYLGPVIADLEPGARRWFRGLLKHTADTDEDAMRLDDYTDKLAHGEREILFRALDEQINNASPAQILKYKQKAIEA